MKRILLIIFALISLNAFSQLQVKEGSFKYIPNGVIEDKAEYVDGNEMPMALIKISTENIPEQERLRLVFTGNRETQILKRPKTGQMWIYISAEAATFIDIKHPDYGTHKYYIPERLCDYCVYEMVLQYIPIVPVSNEPAKPKKTYLIVKSDREDARVYIDDELISTQEASKAVDYGTTHTYKIECNLYHTESGTVTVNDRTTIDKKLRPNFGYINISSSPEQGAKAFVDGDYVGLTPIKTDKLGSGSHKVMVMKDMYKMKEQSFTVADGQTTNATLSMSANFVNVTINTDMQSDIYVDEEYKGKGKWTGRLSDGAHIFEARKSNHKTSVKSLDLVLGETKTITLDSPQPINGDVDINTSPMGATIYIDGKNYGETPNYISDILIGEHELKLAKQGCAEIKKTITIKEGETLTINEKLQTVSKTINVAQSGGDSSVKLTFNQEHKGHEYVDLGLSVKWATCNVGASSPEDYGNYYAWGEITTKTNYTLDNCKTDGKQMSNISGNAQYDAARANWGGSWRMPTKSEMRELIDKCTWTWTTQNGVNGYKVTSKTNGNYIFLPAAGYRNGSSLYYAGSDGCYWSSTPNESNSDDAYGLYFYSSNQGMINYYRDYGRSVRPVIE
ncbi:MAG: PEGA domain-containing protein [Bacteroidales bacterium]|nr:PEGA domain-containing protein [Bacteroidales bacterium]